MAQASKEQIQQLEAAHKNQLAMLAQANNFILNGIKTATTQAQLNTLKAYANKIFPIAQKWHARQYQLEEQANIPKQHPVFFDPAQQQAVNDMVGQINSENKLGFIPLLIWAVVAIVAFFSVDYIVNQLNDTAQEKQDLIQSTADTCKQLNISPAECQKLLEPATTSGSSSGSGIWGIITPIALVAAAIYGVTHIKQIKESFK